MKTNPNKERPVSDKTAIKQRLCKQIQEIVERADPRVVVAAKMTIRALHETIRHPIPLPVLNKPTRKVRGG